jgi:hypothetical protein
MTPPLTPPVVRPGPPAVPEGLVVPAPSRRSVAAPPRRRGRSPRRERRTRNVAAAAILAAFLGLELAVILTVANGPTLDEGIYLTAGRRTLEGSGGTDGYLGWFAGSLLWPSLAGLGDALGGLEGARVVAALLVTIALIGVWRAAAALFGSRAGLCTAALGAVTGPVLALGHLAVIDAPAAAGLGIALWSVAELWRRDHRSWLIAGAAAYAFAVLGKYPVAACGLPLALLLVALRGRRAAMDLTLFAAVVAAVLGTYFLTERTQLAGFVGWRTANNPNFGVTPAMVAVSQLWFTGVPLALGVAGWVACRRKAIASALLFGGVLFPLYHLATANPVGDSKHAVFGILFTLPLAGLLLSRVPRGLPGVVLATLVVGAAGTFGVAQAQRIDRAWVDVDPAARYVAAHARPGDRLLIDDAWPFTRRLYAAGKVRDPWAVVDTYRLAHRQADLPICRYDWFVAAQGAGQWPVSLRRRVAACGTFRRVFASSAPVTSLGRSLRFVTWTGHVEVFRNTRRRRAGAARRARARAAARRQRASAQRRRAQGR